MRRSCWLCLEKRRGLPWWRREEGGGGKGGLVGEGAREEARDEATMAFARESTESWGV